MYQNLNKNGVLADFFRNLSSASPLEEKQEGWYFLWPKKV